MLVVTLGRVLARPTIARVISETVGSTDEQSVTGVSLLEDLHHLNQLEEGHMAVLSRAASASLSRYQIDIAVRLASSAGLAALVLARPLPPGGLQPTARVQAQRNGLTVLHVEDACDVGRLLLDVHEELTSGATAALSRAATALAALQQGGWGEDPVGALAKSVSAHLGVRVGVTTSPEGDQPRIDVLVDGKPHAAFTYEPVDESRSTATTLVLHAAAVVAERTIGDALRASKLSTASRAALLAELIAGSPEEAGPLLRRASRTGLKVDGWHTALHIELDNVIEVTGGDELARYDTLGEAGRLALQTVNETSRRWDRADAGAAIALFRSDEAEPLASTSRTVAQAAEAVMKKLALQFPALRLYCGVGGSYRGLEGLQTTATEARAGAAAAHAARRTMQPVAFRNLGLRRSLLQWYAMGSSRVLVERLLAPLEELGPKGKEQALRTLQAHLEHPGSVADAARALGVHRNTLNNRVKRLFDVLDLDQDNADHRLLLQLACRMHTL